MNDIASPTLETPVQTEAPAWSAVTLAGFLLGRRASILAFANAPHAVWVGLLFVLSAGFAREYDGRYLIGEWWHFVVPLGASLATSFVLYQLVYLTMLRQRAAAQYLKTYRTFLGLYWMTAPLAWLYAIPVERFLSPVDAVKANLWFLAIVAAWRVALMIRIINVFCRIRLWVAVFLVMAFADAVVLILLRLTPLPLVQLMGGVRLTESEGLIDATACYVGLAAFLSAPIWWLGAAIGLWLSRGKGTTAPNVPPGAIGASLWLLSAGSLLLGFAILAGPQREQKLRWTVERDLKEGRILEALNLMSSHPRSDFPTHWDPPPRVGYGEKNPPVIDVVIVILDGKYADWVVALFREKYQRYLGSTSIKNHFPDLFNARNESQMERDLALMERLSKYDFLDARHRRDLTPLLEDKNNNIPAVLRERIKRLVYDPPNGDATQP